MLNKNLIVRIEQSQTATGSEKQRARAESQVDRQLSAFIDNRRADANAQSTD
jgi:hypothetical protein